MTIQKETVTHEVKYRRELQPSFVEATCLTPKCSRGSLGGTSLLDNEIFTVCAIHDEVVHAGKGKITIKLHEWHAEERVSTFRDL